MHTGRLDCDCVDLLWMCECVRVLSLPAMGGFGHGQQIGFVCLEGIACQRLAIK